VIYFKKRSCRSNHNQLFFGTMKVIKIATAVVLLSLTGCTTGSKVKHTINYYSVGEYRPATVPQYAPYTVMRPAAVVRSVRPIYVVEEDPTVTDLGKEITRKIYKKMQAAYYAN
jgi:hypothetical protein